MPEPEQEEPRRRDPSLKSIFERRDRGHVRARPAGQKAADLAGKPELARQQPRRWIAGCCKPGSRSKRMSSSSELGGRANRFSAAHGQRYQA